MNGYKQCKLTLSAGIEWYACCRIFSVSAGLGFRSVSWSVLVPPMCTMSVLNIKHGYTLPVRTVTGPKGRVAP